MGESQPCHADVEPAIITIDGPAASGKSTIGYRLAALLNYLCFDTGIVYRAVTWAALERGVDIGDSDIIGVLAETCVIDIRKPLQSEEDGRPVTVLVDRGDATWGIRTNAVDQNVSSVSAMARVRHALGAQQRRIGEHYGSGAGEQSGIVMVGRDIGTVVLPDAPVKIYLDASPEERARRRYEELLNRGMTVELTVILNDLIERDRHDSQRAHSPLRAAEDAVVIDTTAMVPDQVINTICGLLREFEGAS